MSAWTCRYTDGKAAPKIVPPRPRIPWWKGLGADSEEKHEPATDIDTAVVDSLKVLDPNRPIREADIALDKSRRAKRKSHSAERTDSDDDERWRLPCGQQHEADECNPEVCRTFDRGCPDRII